MQSPLCSLGGCLDGQAPNGIILATDGNFYGTTASLGGYGYGTVFKMTPTGTLTTPYSFCPSYYGCTNGLLPAAGLVQATDGDFYGTTPVGGVNGYGTVFKITPHGTLTTLYSFCSQSACTDGENPYAGLAARGRSHSLPEPQVKPPAPPLYCNNL